MNTTGAGFDCVVARLNASDKAVHVMPPIEHCSPASNKPVLPQTTANIAWQSSSLTLYIYKCVCVLLATGDVKLYVLLYRRRMRSVIAICGTQAGGVA